MDYDIIVIGGGPAGVTAALRARELGASVALIERGRLGGTCTNDGCAPTRVLAKAARLMRDTRQFADYGIDPLQPRLDWPTLIGRIQRVVNTLQEKKQLLSHLSESGVDVRFGAGEARFASPNALRLGDGTALEAGRFIIAAGGRARRLAFPGAERALTHSDLWSLNALPRSVAIIGGAATGCQLASVLAEFGATVTLIDVAPRILPIEEPEVSEVMRKSFEARGIRVITGIQSIAGIEGEPGALTLNYAFAGASQRIAASAVIMAVGWPGNLDALDLPAAGVASARGYITVDDNLRTSAPHIYAAGDITGRMMLVQSASSEGRIAAENALGGASASAHRIVPHGGFTDPEYGSVGLTEAQAGPDGIAATVTYAEVDRAVIDGHTEGFCKLVVGRETGRVLGAHVVGEQAVEVTQLVAAGMAAGITVTQLAALEIAYPTYAAVVGLTARRVAHDLGLMPVGAEWRALGRRYPSEWERRDG